MRYFALVIGMGIAETIYTYGVYDEIYVTLTEVKESIGAEFGQDTLPLTQKAVKSGKTIRKFFLSRQS